MRNRLTSLAISLALLTPVLSSPARVCAETSPVIIRADEVLRGVPPRFLGANMTSYGKSGTGASFAPCCLGPLAQLGGPLPLLRTPGGVLGSFFHFLTGTYADDPNAAQNGVTLDGFAKVARDHGAELLHILNWNAGDEELLNLIDYANGAVPERPDPAWTQMSFKQEQAAPRGYFPWLRRVRGQAKPLSLRYVALGNELWNSVTDRDRRCNHDATCYGQKGAPLSAKLKALDPSLQIGVSILSLGQAQNPTYKNSAVFAGWRDVGLYPDFVSDHAYYRCGYGPRDAAQAEAMVRFADGLGAAAQKTRAELVAAFPDCGPYIGMFLDEFGPQSCAAGPEPFEAFTPWATAAAAHVYAAALHAGYSHVSYSSWNGDPADKDAAGNGLVNGENPGTVDANYWGLWFARRLLLRAVSEVAVEGLPRELRAVAVHAPGLLRLLVVNTSSTIERRLSVEVAGRSVRGAILLAYPADAEHGGLKNPFARRSQVPQEPPLARSQPLSTIDVPPLSTVLLEIDVGDTAAPPGKAAATGCKEELVTEQPVDMAPSGGPIPPPAGCGCQVGGSPPALGLGASIPLLLLFGAFWLGAQASGSSFSFWSRAL